MYYGIDGLDAAILNYPLMGFFYPDDPRVRSMVEGIEEELRVGNLVRRYMLPDGLSGEEGAFVLCSFWLAGCWILLGEKERAAEIIDAMCDMSNHLKLFSEEIDLNSGAFLGNFPQAFSHIGLINSVLNYRTHFPS
jgi:GH15 family glucan-1,4-alpha-glucosidase